MSNATAAVAAASARARSRRNGDEQAASRGFYADTAPAKNHRDPEIARAIVGAKAGDAEAIRFLYLRYRNNVYGYVLSILRNPHEAEDATQHVFVKLITAIHKYEPREVPFTSWILRVAHNVAIDSLRQRRPVPCAEVIESWRAADDVSDERRRGLQEALKALPEDQRGVVVLRHLVGLSPGEIADRMGRTESSIHGLRHRARLALRSELTSVECAPTTRMRAARAA